MDEVCDRHPSARAQARIIMYPSLGELYLCRHCLKGFEKNYKGDEYYIAYAPVTV